MSWFERRAAEGDPSDRPSCRTASSPFPGKPPRVGVAIGDRVLDLAGGARGPRA